MIINDIPHPALKRLVSLDASCRKLEIAFGNAEECDNLLERLETVESIWNDLEDEIPSSDSKIFFRRHLYFIRYYLEEDNKEQCEKDVKSLTAKDIPGISKSLEVATSSPIYHSAIMGRVFPPIKRQEFDSAVRRAFAALKTYLVDKYELSSELDGEDLFNACFGSNGAAQSFLSKSECQAIRNYLSGLSVLYRNSYAHNDIDGEWTEAAAIIVGINLILLRLDD